MGLENKASDYERRKGPVIMGWEREDEEKIKLDRWPRGSVGK